MKFFIALFLLAVSIVGVSGSAAAPTQAVPGKKPGGGAAGSGADLELSWLPPPYAGGLGAYPYARSLAGGFPMAPPFHNGFQQPLYPGGPGINGGAAYGNFWGFQYVFRALIL